MTCSYTFSTVKFVPTSVRDEAVNIGVLLHDPATGLVHKRLTRNWDEVRRRTGIPSLPDLGAIARTEPVKAGDDYLLSLSRHTLPSNIVITAPRVLMPFPTPQEALEWVYRSQISVPDYGRTGDVPASGADAALEWIIREARLPGGSHKREYKFCGAGAPVQFPHVFVRGGEPLAAAFAVSFARCGALGYVKQMLYEIVSIRELGGGGIDFMMFADGGDGAGGGDSRDGAALAGERGVRVLGKDGMRAAVARIRRLVSPPSAQEGGGAGAA